MQLAPPYPVPKATVPLPMALIPQLPKPASRPDPADRQLLAFDFEHVSFLPSHATRPMPRPEPIPAEDQGRPTEEQARVFSMLPLLKTIVGRMAMTLPAYMDQEDLLSVGVVGLMDAAHCYDSTRGMSFRNYAAMRIRGAILDELRKLDWVPRSVHRKAREFREIQTSLEQRLGRAATEKELADAMRMSLAKFEQFLETIRPASFISLQEACSQGQDADEEFTHEDCVADPNGKTSLDASLDEERHALLVESIQALKPIEQKVLALYYYEEFCLREIAEVLGLVESRIWQIHALAIQKVRSRMEAIISDPPSR